MTSDNDPASTLLGGRYLLGEAFASGGMGTLHLGRTVGAGGFSRVVAIKRLFPGISADRGFRQMLLDEARLSSRIRHPNVVPMLDVVEADRDIYVVMDYVHGLSLADLAQRLEGHPVPVEVAVAIVEAVLLGLHAAHEARDAEGLPLGIVHRDVSPQNILVGADGVARLIDFGIAQAATRLQVTEPGVMKGKSSYVAPEQLVREPVARQADVYSAAVVLWELLANRRLFPDADVVERIGRIGERAAPPLATHRDVNDAALDAIVVRALSRDPSQRFPTADAMAIALRRDRATASTADVARWMATTAADDLEISDERVRLLERLRPDGSNENGDARAGEGTFEPLTANASARTRTATTRTGTAAVTGTAARVRARKRTAAWIGAAVVAVAVVAFVVIRGVGARARAANAAVVISTVSGVAPTSSAPGPASEVAPPLPTPSEVASGAISAATAPPSGKVTVASTPPRGSTKPRHAVRSDCDPPYTVDAKGFKHYHRNCF
ncbi:MAG TPA: protein kinase [Polyangiaceae bacterium]|nr:protein kinase [Polyangiaceae bacterium]